MSRRDTSHETVRRSLERDGWTITHDPYPIRLGDLPMGIDLGAEKLIAADRQSGRFVSDMVSRFLSSQLMRRSYRGSNNSQQAGVPPIGAVICRLLAPERWYGDEGHRG